MSHVPSGAPAHSDPAPLHPPSRGRIVLLTGGPGAGKTRVCRDVIDEVTRKGLRAAGLLCEARQLSSGRIVQTVVNLRTGERRRLADYVGTEEGDPIGRGLAGRLSWQFIGESLRWGRNELWRCASSEVDLFVVDQLGPLELIAGSGWTNAVAALGGARFGLALVVVNPLVLEQVRGRLPADREVVIEVNERNRELLPEHLLTVAGWSTPPASHLLGAHGPDVVAVDLDGTLLDSSGDPLAPGIEAALQDLPDTGVTLCVCTGRPTDFALAAARALGVDRGYVIAYGGAETRSLGAGEVIERVALPAGLVEMTQEVARELGLNVTLHDSPAGPLRLVLTGPDQHVAGAVLALQKTIGDAAVLLRPSAGVVAVQSAAATKARALSGLVKRLGIVGDAVAYLGDGDDDAAALAWAGLGIAVGSASNEAIAAADTAVSRSQVAETLVRLALARRLRAD